MYATLAHRVKEVRIMWLDSSAWTFSAGEQGLQNNAVLFCFLLQSAQLFRPCPRCVKIKSRLNGLKCLLRAESFSISAWRDSGMPPEQTAEKSNILVSHRVADLLHAAAVAF